MTDKDALLRAVAEFEEFINEPPAYENRLTVRDYRHSIYARWADLRARITAALAEKDDGWVKCSERLPKKSDADERGHVWGYVNGTAGLHDWEWFHTPYAIKHNCMWRPLPPLPKGDE